MGQETRKDPRAKVLTMTVRYKSATLDEFIEHHSHDVSRGGMFIKTPSPFPPGTLLKFEVKIGRRPEGDPRRGSRGLEARERDRRQRTPQRHGREVQSRLTMCRARPSTRSSTRATAPARPNEAGGGRRRFVQDRA